MEEQLERVVLVDANDAAVGTEEKLLAHQRGLLHRAFSVFIINSQGAVLLQKRARGKYHSGGLWTNACCGHPRPEEPLERAARRRLREEMGISSSLLPLRSFTYRAEVAEGVVEHEIDHVFVGRSDSLPDPDPEEVEEWKWCTRAELEAELASRPATFTAWFAPAWTIVASWLDRNSRPNGSLGGFAA